MSNIQHSGIGHLRVLKSNTAVNTVVNIVARKTLNPVFVVNPPLHRGGAANEHVLKSLKSIKKHCSGYL